ncbi:MAG: pyridoxamine 5'-phosphate oxidase [Pseudomonadales bacterium]
MSDLGELRREYRWGGLSRDDLDNDPVSQFNKWFDIARDAGVNDPSAMVVATVNAQGQPNQRTVLLKYFDRSGFVFFTNMESTKAKELAGNDQISLLFPWYELDRQVIIRGTATQVSSVDAARYFLSRPHDSQIATWISDQSRPVKSRQMLMAKFDEVKTRFASGDMSVPKFWGGYRIEPQTVEFWQGRESRLHDRFYYTRTDSEWHIERLAP